MTSTGVDNLHSGRRENAPEGATFVEGDLRRRRTDRFPRRFDACVHFAARIEPGESMKFPEVFFSNNVASSFRTPRSTRSHRRAAVRSSPRPARSTAIKSRCPSTSNVRRTPTGPYGQSKLMVEQGLEWLVAQGRLRAASLRYFNAAGATLAQP